MLKKAKLVLALQKGRVLEEFLNLIKDTKFNLIENPKNTRKLLLDTTIPELKVLIIRGWDVPTYVTSGAAQLGVVGKDILMEKGSEDCIELADLKIGNCRMAIAGQRNNVMLNSKLKIGTKYPQIAKNYFTSIGIQPEIIYLHGSQEIAPSLGLADVVLDLVDTGNTLQENDLKELKIIKNISSRLIANRAALKTKQSLIEELQFILSES